MPDLAGLTEQPASRVSLPVVPASATRPEHESDEPQDERDDGDPPQRVDGNTETEEQRDQQQKQQQGDRHFDLRLAMSRRQPLTSISMGNDQLGRSLATPFRLLGRLSFPVYSYHFPLLCSLACALFVLLRPVVSLQVTLLLVAAVYAPLVIGVGYLFARVDDVWLRWVDHPFAARLTRPEPA